jgi:hypothetical protein
MRAERIGLVHSDELHVEFDLSGVEMLDLSSEPRQHFPRLGRNGGVMAISVYAVAKGQNLLRPMLTGRKQLPDQIAPPRVTSLTLAGVVLGGSVAMVALLATFL